MIKRTMVLLLMVLVLAVGLALPSTALAAKRPHIDIQATISVISTTTSASTTTINSGEPVQLQVVVYNASSVTLTNFCIEIPQLWWEGVYWTPTSDSDNDKNTVLDPGETTLFVITIDGIKNAPCPTKSTRYTVDLVGTDWSVDPHVSYYISNAAQVRVAVTR